MIFFASFLVLFILGFSAERIPNKFALPLFAFVLVFPSSTSFSFMNTYQGIYYYDSIIVGAVFSYVTRLIERKPFYAIRIDWKITTLVGIYTLYIFAALYNGALLKYLIKDIRPLILIIECFIVYELICTRIGVIKRQKIEWLMIVLGICTLIKLIAFQSSLGVINDQFYEDNSYRYLDAATYFSVAYLIYCLAGNVSVRSWSFLTLISIVSALGVVLIANSRFILMAVCVVIILSRYKDIKKLFNYTILASILGTAFVVYSFYFGSDRVIDAFEYENLKYQILSRYEPALNMIEGFTLLNFVVGTGLGDPFYIPWFSYRDNLDPFNVNIDSAYFTFFCKFGLISLLIGYIFLNFFSYSKNSSFEKKLAWFLAFMFIVSATPYQIYAIGIFIGAIILKEVNTTNV